MALRTFRSNPSLGGFGSGEADGDAFCQIIKELTDNAVDACSATNDDDDVDRRDPSRGTTPKRVRVAIEDFVDETVASGDGPLLRVTVSDNGCGMKNIQACVDPFSTSKAHQCDTSSVEKATAGRYGIGLTLCLLHAQRLVPDSCTRIKSATRGQSHWTEVTCVVDTDRVECIRRATIPKSAADDSGTSIGILVPGGSTAERVWPRLAEYFARFRLSLGLPCSLEVLAPTLSAIPLVVRRPNAAAQLQKQPPTSSSRSSRMPFSRVNSATDLPAIRQSLEHYLGRSVNPRNMAHAVVPIRFPCGDAERPLSPPSGTRPEIEMCLAVHGTDDRERETDAIEGNSDEDDDEPNSNSRDEGIAKVTRESGSMVLIRMVNRIPLLDSAEGIACGFVRGLASKKSLWNSFGLNVSLCHQDGDAMKLPQYEVRDSDQLAPFFQQGSHDLLAGGERGNDSYESSESEQSVSNASSEVARKRRREGIKKMKPRLLPAKVRLAHILCMVQIHAKPTELPLPTLSKGRLPLDNEAIDNALELALTQCLRQLQKTNPGLLLTPSELRIMERDYRYVPLVAAAVASVVSNLSEPTTQKKLLDTIQKWSEVEIQVEPQDLLDSPEEGMQENRGSHLQRNTSSSKLLMQELASLIESRLGATVSKAGTKKKTPRSKVVGKSDEESSGGQSDSRSICLYKDLLRGGDSKLAGSRNDRADATQGQGHSDGGSLLSSDGGFDDWL